MKEFYFLFRTFLILAAFLKVNSAEAQTANSKANGNWANPLTWDCNCIPYTGYTVNITHNVTLNSDLGFYSGSITVGNGGKLIQDATGRTISIIGIPFTNNGIIKIKTLYAVGATIVNNDSLYVNVLSTLSNFTNAGVISGVDSLYTNGVFKNNSGGSLFSHAFFADSIFNNYGNILQVDSMTNAGKFSNYGTIYSDSILNIDTLDNMGNIDCFAIYNAGVFHNISGSLNFADFTNSNYFSNEDTLTGTNSMTNFGDMYNSLPNGFIQIDNSFLNTDSMSGDGYFINDGIFLVGQNWYNYDSIFGSGRFEIQNVTANFGFMSGNFEFCDLTPTAISPPYIDFNSGTIDNGITWCSPVTDIIAFKSFSSELFPNPAENFVKIKWNHFSDYSPIIWKIYNIIGEEVLTGKLSGNETRFDVSSLSSGTYFVKISSGSEIKTEKLIIRK